MASSAASRDGEGDGEEGHADRRRDEARAAKTLRARVAGQQAPRVPERDHRQSRLALGLSPALANDARLVGLGPAADEEEEASHYVARRLPSRDTPLETSPELRACCRTLHTSRSTSAMVATPASRSGRAAGLDRYDARDTEQASLATSAKRGTLLGAHQAPHHLLRPARDQLLAGVLRAQRAWPHLLRGARVAVAAAAAAESITSDSRFSPARMRAARVSVSSTDPEAARSAERLASSPIGSSLDVVVITKLRRLKRLRRLTSRSRLGRARSTPRPEPRGRLGRLGRLVPEELGDAVPAHRVVVLVEEGVAHRAAALRRGRRHRAADGVRQGRRVDVEVGVCLGGDALQREERAHQQHDVRRREELVARRHRAGPWRARRSAIARPPPQSNTPRSRPPSPPRRALFVHRLSFLFLSLIRV